MYILELTLNKLETICDSDDIQSLSDFIEYNVSKEDLMKLKKMLKEYLGKNGTTLDEAIPIKQLLGFLI